MSTELRQQAGRCLLCSVSIGANDSVWSEEGANTTLCSAYNKTLWARNAAGAWWSCNRPTQKMSILLFYAIFFRKFLFLFFRAQLSSTQPRLSVANIVPTTGSVQFTIL